MLAKAEVMACLMPNLVRIDTLDGLPTTELKHSLKFVSWYTVAADTAGPNKAEKFRANLTVILTAPVLL